MVIEAHGGTWFRTPCPIVVRSRSNICSYGSSPCCLAYPRIHLSCKRSLNRRTIGAAGGNDVQCCWWNDVKYCCVAIAAHHHRGITVASQRHHTTASGRGEKELGFSSSARGVPKPSLTRQFHHWVPLAENSLFFEAPSLWLHLLCDSHLCCYYEMKRRHKMDFGVLIVGSTVPPSVENMAPTSLRSRHACGCWMRSGNQARGRLCD